MRKALLSLQGVLLRTTLVLFRSPGQAWSLNFQAALRRSTQYRLEVGVPEILRIFRARNEERTGCLKTGLSDKRQLRSGYGVFWFKEESVLVGIGVLVGVPSFFHCTESTEYTSIPKSLNVEGSGASLFQWQPQPTAAALQPSLEAGT